MLETPYIRDVLPREIQLARDEIDALRNTNIPASVRLRNAAVLYMQHHVEMPSRVIPVSTWSSTPWAELKFIIMQYSNILYHVIREITNSFEVDGVGIGLREATVDPNRKKAVRFARKQRLICQVLIACSDAQTMTGIRLTRNGVG